MAVNVLKSERHNLINTDKAVASATENCKMERVRGETEDRQTDSKQATRPATEILRTESSSIVCTYKCVCNESKEEGQLDTTLKVY